MPQKKKPTTKTTKKTVKKPVKKTVKKATQAKKVVAHVASIQKQTKDSPAVPVQKELKVSQAEATKAEPKQAKKKTYELSRFGYSLFIGMIVLLYALLIAAMVVDYKYDVQFHEHNRQTIQQKAPRSRTRSIRRDRPSQTGKKAVKRRRELPVSHTTKKADHTASPALKCPPLVKRNVVFNEVEYEPYAKQGEAAITGKLCVKLTDGSDKCFEGANVFINPVTSYSNEWYNRGWAGKENLERADERAFKFNKMTSTDKDGHFAFENLAPGSYYVGAAICVPETKDSPKCEYRRYATKVTMHKFIDAKLKKVYP